MEVDETKTRNIVQTSSEVLLTPDTPATSAQEHLPAPILPHLEWRMEI